MKYILILTIYFLLLIQACKENKPEDSISDNTASVENIYRVFLEEKDSFIIWIVDGFKIRNNIFPEFIYGGNPERYTFVPEGEIWIDNSIASEELYYTIEHEICERNLMYFQGYTYFDAHDSALQLEQILRVKNESDSKKHESEIKKVCPIDFDSVKQIEKLPDQISLRNIYRQLYQIKDGISVWIVDGSRIRREIYTDFGFSGNDIAYKFIPSNEIWIDGQISCEEIIYSIELEIAERRELERGIYYDEAYLKGLDTATKLRKENSIKCSKILKQDKFSIPYRDTGRGVLNPKN